MDLKHFVERLVKTCLDEKNRVVITGHDMPDGDSVISAVMLNRLLSEFGVEAVVKFPTAPDNVTLRDMKTLGFWRDEYISGLESDDSLILVDHHATFYKNKVIGCVDHHTTPPEPIFSNDLILKASSCGKIIYDMAVECGCCDLLMKKMALYSVFLDTQSCRSSKFNKKDLPWVEKMIDECAVDRLEIERMGFCLMSPDEDAGELAMYAYKRYEFDGILSASTAIQIDSSEVEWELLIPRIVEYLKVKLGSDGYKMWAFVLNIPIESRSDIYFIYPDRIEILKLDRLASRSKDVIPIANSL